MNKNSDLLLKHSSMATNYYLPTDRNNPVELIETMLLIKKACAWVNVETGFLENDVGESIIKSIDMILNSQDYHLVIVPPIQGGAGTSFNYNINEMIIEVVKSNFTDLFKHTDFNPNDTVNLHQSTNDVYPTAIKIASLKLLLSLEQKLSELQQSFQTKESEFSSLLKIGRTQYQDALPITLGQEFSAYSEAISRDRWRVFKAQERLRILNIGGTAIGTGINAPKIYRFKIIDKIRELTHLNLSQADNLIDQTQNADIFSEVSGILKTVAVNLIKISNDLRFLSSGPACGINEIHLSNLLEGSTIMPNKVNPVIPEFVIISAYQVIANDTAITNACFSGHLELNPFLPLIAYNLIDSIKLLINACDSFNHNCILSLKPNLEKLNYYFQSSLIKATILTPYLGYQKTNELIEYAKNNQISIEETLLKLNIFSKEEINILFDIKNLTNPGISGSKILKNKLLKRSKNEN